ncbi:hypothetical protein OEZ85_003130 [Tetradesmus obliquus]|uniref:Nucleolar protein 6 n=1 Tax=Tetradesmus obliquus TaxID=3088 RepID=A0ABY8TZS0_TETOB|nr:hypothetical protein OEZ85_003130 [Tetradesmus obliquus]
MDFSDDDVSASGDALEHDENGNADFEQDDSDAAGSDSEEAGDADMPQAQAVAAAAAKPVAGRQEVQAAQDALLGGEISTNAALLQLQLSELLSEVSLCKQPGLQAAAEALVGQLQKALAGTPARVLTGDADQGLAALISSWGLEPQGVCCSIRAPAAVQLIGSWALGAAGRLPGAAAAVDVAVQMPSSCLRHKDILNYRYHAKRAVFLSALAAQLATDPLFAAAEQQLAPMAGNPCRPVLLLHLNPKALAAALQQQGSAAAGFGQEGLVLRLLPAVGLDAFEVSKLSPDRNNVSGHLNLAAAVSRSSLQLAQMAAARSLAILNRADLEPDAVYDAVFRPGLGLAGLFDYWWSVELPQQQQQQLGDQHPMRLAEAQVEGLVRQALTTRALLVKTIRQPPSYSPQQQQQQPAAATAAAAVGPVAVPRRILVGVIADPVAALRAVDVGPAADDAAAAAKFRALWGDKSELRSRHTCCFYPEPHPLAEGLGSGAAAAAAAAAGGKVPRVLEAIDVMVQLEGTGRMPSDAAAFAKTKAALGVQLADALAAACGAHATATEDAVEVLWQGFAFKLLLFMDRDTPMLGADAAAGSHVPLPLLLSRHHGLISSLEAAHAAYGPTVRLAKRWLGLQLLLGPTQVCEEAVELLVAGVFQGPSSCPPPASRISGLLRFLQLLASHPWAAAPLLIDPAGDVKPDARRALQVEYEARRAAGTLPGMFLATPYDLHSSRWTAHQPSQSVAHHLVSLARAAHQQLSQLLLSGPDAPLAQQQLQQLQQQQRRLAAKKLKQTHTDNAASPEQQQQRDEMAALARAWRSVCGPNLAGFDAWVLLRPEALPFAGRGDPLAAAQLQQQLKAQRRRCEAILQSATEAAEAAADGQAAQKKRKHNDGENQAAAVNGVGSGSSGSSGSGAHGALGALLAAGLGLVEAPKASRAVLRSIPEQLLLTKSADKLRSELLVGFDPVSLFLNLCCERYGHLATFCADPSGGFGAIGIKWKPEAFLPAPLRPNHAHGMLAIGATAAGTAAAAAGGKQKGAGVVRRGQHVGLVVPNVCQVLGEVAEMGLGLVQQVVLLQ